MKKKIIVTVLAILCLFLVVINLGNDETIVTAFNNAGVTKPSSVVKVYGMVNKYHDINSRAEAVKAIAEKLLITDMYTVETEYKEGKYKYTLNKEGDNAATKISFVSMEKQEGENEVSTTQYMVAEIELNNNVDNSMKYCEILKEEFTKMGLECQVNISFEGGYAGELSEKEKEAKAKNICKTMRAKIRDYYKENGVFIAYGYSSQLKELSGDENSKTNISIQMEYNEINDITEFLVVIPG